MIVKHLLFLLTFTLLLPELLPAAEGFKKIFDISGPRREAETVTLIAAPGNKIASFAAEEAFRLLKRGGNNVVKSSRPRQNSCNIFIGSSAAYPLTRQDLSPLPAGAFRIIKDKTGIFIFGKDTPAADLKRLSRPDGFGYEKGSLYGTYEFLERFAGIRFYFPGPVGTIVPRRKPVLPEKIDILDFPDMEERYYLPWPSTSGKMYPGCREYTNPPPHLLNTCRSRANTIAPNMSNALQHGDYLKRFYRTHPEYFALHANGKRVPDTRERYKTQFCLNSGIEEEIYQDIKAYFLGKPASGRGMKKWDRFMFSPRGVNMTHEDAFYWCACQKCRKTGLDKEAYTDPEVRKKISTEVWKFTCRIAERLKREKVPNARLILLAYVPYDTVPDCDIPDNVLPVVVVFPGVQGDTPTLKRNDAILKAWQKKCKGRILLRAWTGKYMLRRFPDIPDLHHNIICDYFALRRDWFGGAFIAEGTDRFLFRHLNLYLFFKYTWNRKTDLKAVMEEYFTLMYGKGAPFVRRYFDILEKIWDKKLVKDMKDTLLGGEADIASEREIWTEIFTDQLMEELDLLWLKAAYAAKNDRETLGRIRFMRKELFLPLRKRKVHFLKTQKAIDSWILRPGETVWARPRKGDTAEVITTFQLTEKTDALEFDFFCQEPEMKHIRARAKKEAQGEVWRDADVEIFLNPSGDRKNYIQFCINANGVLDTIISGKGLQKKNLASVTVNRYNDHWRGTLKVPKKMLGRYRKSFPALLARRRLLEKTGPKIKEEFYAWLAMTDPPGFQLPEYWGMIDLSGRKETGLIKNSTLAGLTLKDASRKKFYLSLRDRQRQKISFDKKCFVSGGQSLLIESRTVKGQTAFQLPVEGLKAHTRYRLSFFCKLDNVKGEGLDVCLYAGKKAIHPMRLSRLSGTHPWHRLSFDITTAPDTPSKGLVIAALRMAKGKVRIDNIRLDEIK